MIEFVSNAANKTSHMTPFPRRKTATYRSIMGWTGWFLYVYAAMDIHLEFLPVAVGTLRFEKVKQR